MIYVVIFSIIWIFQRLWRVNNINSAFAAQHSGCQIYGQEQVKRDQGIFVDEQSRTCQTGKHFSNNDIQN